MIERAGSSTAIRETVFLYGLDDAPIGTILEFIWHNRETHVVVNIRGFLGIGCKIVTLPVRTIELLLDESGHLYAKSAWTKDELYVLPGHNAK